MTSFCCYLKLTQFSFLVGPQTACKGLKEACMCSPQSEENPADAAAQDETEQAERFLLRQLFQELVSYRKYLLRFLFIDHGNLEVLVLNFC